MKARHWLVTALVTTAVVLLVIGIANRIPFTAKLVGLSLNPGGA